MKYLRQLIIILLFAFLGELLHFLLPLPIPASVCGLLLLLLALCSGAVRLDQIKETADFLLEIMPVMFLPAAAGLLDVWPELQHVWAPVLLITLLTTVLVMAVTGRVTQRLIRKGERRSDDERSERRDV